MQSLPVHLKQNIPIPNWMYSHFLHCALFQAAVRSKTKLSKVAKLETAVFADEDISWHFLKHNNSELLFLIQS